jgi:hypothetical protein
VLDFKLVYKSVKIKKKFTFVIVACRSYVCLGREKVIHAKKQEREEIKVRYDERKKFLCKPQVVIVCIV